MFVDWGIIFLYGIQRTYIIVGFILNVLYVSTYNTYFIPYDIVYTVLSVTTMVYSTCMSE